MNIKPTMKAVRIHEYGNKQVLMTENVTSPEISDSEVLIEVINTSVNPLDWKVREGWLADENLHQLPLTLGWDVSGRIVKTGSDVGNFTLGDEVFAFSDITRNGAYAEYIAVNASSVAAKPKNLSHAQAAAVPLTSLTAWQAINDISNIKSGDRVLIHGASGGVGSFAVQFAKMAGAKVTAVSSAKNHDYLLSLGADAVVDYSQPDYLAELGIFETVFDIVDNDVETIYNNVAPKGLYIATLKLHDIPQRFSFDHQRVLVMPNGNHLGQIAALIDNRQIQLPDISEMAFEQISDAHDLSETEHVRGKLVISI